MHIRLHIHIHIHIHTRITTYTYTYNMHISIYIKISISQMFITSKSSHLCTNDQGTRPQITSQRGARGASGTPNCRGPGEGNADLRMAKSCTSWWKKSISLRFLVVKSWVDGWFIPEPRIYSISTIQGDAGCLASSVCLGIWWHRLF